MMAELQALRGNTSWMKEAQSLQKRKGSLPFTKLADLERAVQVMEGKMAQETLSIKEEKQLMEQIRKLKTVAKDVARYEQDNQSISEQREEFRKVSTEIAPQTERMNTLKNMVN